MNDHESGNWARFKADEFLRSLVEGTVAATGGQLLRALVFTGGVGGCDE